MMVWQAHERNEWDVAIHQALGAAEGPMALPSGTADPFSLADPAAVTEILEAARFADVAFTEVCEPVYYGPDVAAALGWVRGFTDTSEVLKRLAPAAAVRAVGRLQRLGIDKWLLTGASWGATLALAYAQQHPERVTEMIIPAVTMTRPSETSWLYEGAGRFYPEAWDRFRDGLPEPERGGDLLAAYARLMENPDRAVREKAAADWLAWEDAVISNEPNGIPGMYSNREVDAQIAFVRICAHFFSNGAWLAEDQLLHNAHKLAGIPAVLVHGRHDMGSPVQTAWELAKAWPDAQLHIIEDSGHAGSDTLAQTVRTAIEEFKGH